MLIEFSVQNFKTFKSLNTISLLASSDNSRKDDNLFSTKFGFEVLKSAVIYGPNAGGKTKFIEALDVMRYFTLNSAKESQKGDVIPVDPFRLNKETRSQPTFFEVVFSYKDILYRYGFEASKKEVVSEWLYYKPNVREIELFQRKKQTFTTHKSYFKQGRILINEKMVRNNTLLVSAAAQFNDKTCIEVIEWFKSLSILQGLHDERYQGLTASLIDHIETKSMVLRALEVADLGIEDLNLVEVGVDDLPDFISEHIKKSQKNNQGSKIQVYSDVLATRKIYNKEKEVIGKENFSLDKDESAGTRKYFSLIGPIIDTLIKGRTLIVDELDSKLHPVLMCNIIALFNSKGVNRKNAQLIFNTHDTSLLSKERNLFRRDQVWFINKNRYGEASLYSLAEFKTNAVRKDDDFEFKYLIGKFGSIPYIQNFEEIISKLLWNNE